MHAVVRHVVISLSADFRPGRPFPFTTRSYTFGNNRWAVILQHRDRGCCPFVGGNRPERSKFVSELPLPYLEINLHVRPL